MAMFIRRLGVVPGTLPCSGGRNCPDLLELVGGDFAVIGKDITATAARHLPPGSGCGDDERIVRIPRDLLVRARQEIPAHP